MKFRDEIARHLRQLAPHVADRDTGRLLAAAIVEIDKRDEEVAELTKKLATMTRIAEYDHKSCLLYDPGYPQFNDPAAGDYLSDLLAKEREKCASECDKEESAYVGSYFAAEIRGME
jgi:hypothetical protein